MKEDNLFVESDTLYFPRVGRQNTEQVLSLVKARALELGISTIVVASTSGRTGVQAVEFFSGFKVVVVTLPYGYPRPGNRLREDYKAQILEKGGHVLTTTQALAGVSRAVRRKLGTYQVGEIVAHALRIFGQGMKVVCEITVMAADAGLIRTDEEVIVIAGRAGGADTAAVVKPVHAQDFFDLQIREILCKPRQWPQPTQLPPLQEPMLV
ncbi:MAG: hypothetical protein HYU86_04230 [Chloroflexi bacterium]|nr:hypothetical protein [Chloroflexota bacterium]